MLTVRPIVQGIVVVLSLQCMGALLTDPKRGVRWILVAHTCAIFSLVTVYTAMSFNIQSVSYVDNREFPGVDDAAPPGPLGHQVSAYLKADNVARTAAYVLSNWLTDGFLVSPEPMLSAQVPNVARSARSYIVSGLFFP